jgi:hypothetical protein
LKNKTILTNEDKVKELYNGRNMKIAPNGINYINWCIIEIESFYISKSTIELLKRIDSNFYLKKEAEENLEKKFNDWFK